MTPEDIKALCKKCADNIWGTRPPTPRYAQAVADLLLGTAAQESNLIHTFFKNHTYIFELLFSESGSTDYRTIDY